MTRASATDVMKLVSPARRPGDVVAAPPRPDPLEVHLATICDRGDEPSALFMVRSPPARSLHDHGSGVDLSPQPRHEGVDGHPALHVATTRVHADRARG